MNRLNLILLCSLVLVSFLFFRSCENAQSDRRQLHTLLNATEQEIEYWKDANGTNKARAITYASEIQILRKHYTVLDSLKLEVKGLKKNLSNLESSIQASTVTERHSIETRLIPDSAGHKFAYKDNWLEIKGTVATDKLMIDKLISRDSLSFVSYYRSKGFFKRPELTIEATSYNPHSRFTGVRQFKVEEPAKRFSVGPYLGVGVNGVQIGVGVQYSVLRF
jgi:hypothetical protein